MWSRPSPYADSFHHQPLVALTGLALTESSQYSGERAELAAINH